MIGLQRNIGNQPVARLVAVQRQSREPTEYAPEHVNIVNTVHELRRAIDQTNTEEVGSFWWGKRPVRPIQFAIVDHVLTGLAPSQVREVSTEYKAETQHDLRNDLLDTSPNFLGAPVPSSLGKAERARVQALLEGTALDPMGATSAAVLAGAVPVTWASAGPVGAGGELRPLKSLPDTDGEHPAVELSEAEKVIRRNRAYADAAALKILLDTDNDANRKQIMGMLRKSAEANSYVTASFKSQFDEELTHALGRLPGLAEQRALALFTGQWQVADAYAIEMVRQKIAKLDDPMIKAAWVFGQKGDLAAARGKLFAEIEEILATVNNEAAAGGIDSVADVLAVHLAEGAEPGFSLGDLLHRTLGPAEQSVIDAMRTGDPVDEAVARLSLLDRDNKAGAKDVASILRGLRARADQDVGRERTAQAAEAVKNVPPDQRGQLLMAMSDSAPDEVENRAHVYIARLITRFDQLADRGEGEHRRFAAIVEAWETGADQELVNSLVHGGGMLKPIEELGFAMGKKDRDLVTVANVLRRLSVAIRRQRVAAYDAEYGQTRGTLAQAVSGRVVTFGRTQVKLPRTDQEAAVAELIEAPEPGGQDEINWASKWTRDTYERGIAEGGLTAEIADTLGGKREVRELLDDSDRALTDARIAFDKADSPAEQLAALMKVQDARAAMSVDKDAFVSATDALRVSIANTLAIAVDIALTIMVPGAGKLVGRLASAGLSLAANIGTKVAILQDQYGPEMLKSDLIGAAVSMGFAAPSRALSEEAAGLVGRSLAGKAGELGVVISPELKAFGRSAAGHIGETYLTTGYTNLAQGHSWGEGQFDAQVIGGLKAGAVAIKSGTKGAPGPTRRRPGLLRMNRRPTMCTHGQRRRCPRWTSTACPLAKSPPSRGARRIPTQSTTLWIRPPPNTLRCTSAKGAPPHRCPRVTCCRSSGTTRWTRGAHTKPALPPTRPARWRCFTTTSSSSGQWYRAVVTRWAPSPR
jgi:hypothetical protein